MKPFLEQCIESYVSLVGTDSHLSAASTPFIDEDDTSNPARQPAPGNQGLTCPWCKGCFPKSSFQEHPRKDGARGTGGTNSSTCATDGSDVSEDKCKPEGELSLIAATVIMKVFYAARVARFDPLRAVAIWPAT